MCASFGFQRIEWVSTLRVERAVMLGLYEGNMNTFRTDISAIYSLFKPSTTEYSLQLMGIFLRFFTNEHYKVLDKDR